MSVTMTLDGAGIQFERDISERAALRMMELALDNGETVDDSGVSDTPSEEEVELDEDEFEGLPDGFLTRMSEKQEAMIKVLFDADDWVSSTELRERMETDHGVETRGGRSLAGIQSGFTRRFGKDFDLIVSRWRTNQGEFKLNPDRPDYLRDLEEYFAESSS